MPCSGSGGIIRECKRICPEQCLKGWILPFDKYLGVYHKTKETGSIENTSSNVNPPFSNPQQFGQTRLLSADYIEASEVLSY